VSWLMNVLKPVVDQEPEEEDVPVEHPSLFDGFDDGHV